MRSVFVFFFVITMTHNIEKREELCWKGFFGCLVMENRLDKECREIEKKWAEGEGCQKRASAESRLVGE